MTAPDTAHPNLTRLLALAREHGADIDNFARRILQDAEQHSRPAYWSRRAQEFTRVGNPACDEIAQACRNAAAFHQYLSDPDTLPAPARAVHDVLLQAVS